jgi:hypothetical protein
VFLIQLSTGVVKTRTGRVPLIQPVIMSRPEGAVGIIWCILVCM